MLLNSESCEINSSINFRIEEYILDSVVSFLVAFNIGLIICMNLIMGMSLYGMVSQITSLVMVM